MWPTHCPCLITRNVCLKNCYVTQQAKLKHIHKIPLWLALFVTHRSYHIAYTDLYRFILMVCFQLTHIHTQANTNWENQWHNSGKTIKNFIALYSCHSYVSEKVKILQVWLGYQKLQLKVWTFPSDCLLWLLLLLPLLTVGLLTQFDANLQNDC